MSTSFLRIAYDGSRRRRIYLLRHGDVSYVNAEGFRVKDSNAVPLTAWGREQTTETGKALKNIKFDRAVCSTLPRTLETLQCVLDGQKQAGADYQQPIIEQWPEFVEVQGGSHRDPNMTPEEALYDMAYAFRNADKPGASYHGGDVYADLMKRTEGAMERLLKEEAWETMIIVAHGGVNRFVLSWCMGSEDLRGFARWDQNTSCYNIIDVDQAPSDDFKSGENTFKKGDIVRRKSLRAMNVTAFDIAKEGDYLTSLEQIAGKLRAGLRN